VHKEKREKRNWLVHSKCHAAKKRFYPWMHVDCSYLPIYSW